MSDVCSQTSDVTCFMSGVRRLICDTCMMSDVRRLMCDIIMPDVKHLMCDMCDVCCQMSVLMTYNGHQTSYVFNVMSDVICLSVMSDI